MRLYLVRHGEAFEPSAKRWPDDRLRPLTPAGARAFRVVARGIVRVAGPVDEVRTSPLVRARQTAEILSSAGGWPLPVEAHELCPEESAQRALDAVRSTRADRVAIVGHEPNLRRLISLAVAGSAKRADFSIGKGAAACLEFPSAVRAGEARLVWLIRPETLRELAKR